MQIGFGGVAERYAFASASGPCSTVFTITIAASSGCRPEPFDYLRNRIERELALERAHRAVFAIRDSIRNAFATFHDDLARANKLRYRQLVAGFTAVRARARPPRLRTRARAPRAPARASRRASARGTRNFRVQR